ncbi:MAG: recombinase family protein, partial [Oscillospiraceae bacterium]
MRAWLYYRLSRDEDREMNSLQNQREILVDYAEQNGHEIVGESFDDNVSGMTFKRKGLSELELAVDEGLIDMVLVKDLSRLGRHKTQTALFIDHLRENNVKVISVTEGIDTDNENDDLLIGFKQIINDFYAKDIGKKVRTGIRQKQKTGLVVNLPMGYYKD